MRSEATPAAAGRSRRRLALALLALSAMMCPVTVSAQDDLRCVLKAPARAAAGKPVMLRFSLTNLSAAPVMLLEWNTPFEGWFAPFVDVTRDGVALPYRGPMVKRGDPSADEYLRLLPRRARSASVDLAQPFDFSMPGRYRVVPRIRVLDVVRAGELASPRPLDRHVPVALACNPVEIEVR
ncbi:hypothetical protein [Piscinibacter sp. XHJ-5]|uniref:hypothetical protein n=1 Tax=Piscinibacter sp. XHJ-5 TaxID=3037797 RepID=UPI0024534ADE|nr:hypothetical protein [Piscinibacter sp. XHJ-5]